MLKADMFQKSRTTIVACVASLTLFFGGCAGARYGALQRSPEASKFFDSGKVLPQYRYYTTGAQNVPDAILAVDRKFTLKNTVWREEELDEKRLKRLVFNLKYSSDRFSDIPYGMKVIGPEGEGIGYWFSDLTFTTVTMPSAAEVVIQSPATIRAARPDLQRAVDSD